MEFVVRSITFPLPSLVDEDKKVRLLFGTTCGSMPSVSRPLFLEQVLASLSDSERVVVVVVVVVVEVSNGRGVGLGAVKLDVVNVGA